MLKIIITNDGTANIPENIATPPNGKPFTMVGHYDYKIYIDNKMVGQGRIASHNRLTGWEGLISCLNKAINGDRFEE